MKEERKDRYVQFPIDYLADILSGSTLVFDDILKYGVGKLTEKIDCTESQAINNLIYQNCKHNLSKSLTRIFQDYSDQLDYFGYDEYSRFYEGEFQPIEEEYDELKQLLEDQPYIMTKAIEFYKAGRVCKILNIDYVEPSFDTFGQYKGKAHASIKIENLFDFRDNNPTQRELERLAVYCAINSKLGTKGYYLGLDYKTILARTMGFNSYRDIPKYNALNKHLKSFYDRYYPIDENSNQDKNTRRRRKLLTETIDKWHLVRVNDNGMAIAKASVMTKADLVLMIAKNKLKKETKSNDADLIREAMEKLKQDETEQLPF